MATIAAFVAGKDRSIVVDTSRSPHSRLRPVPMGAVRMDDAFWAPRLRTVRTVTLGQQYEQCEQTGRVVPPVAIPYYAWSNRAPGPLQVWMPYRAPSWAAIFAAAPK